MQSRELVARYAWVYSESGIQTFLEITTAFPTSYSANVSFEWKTASLIKLMCIEQRSSWQAGSRSADQ
jgi:hypothetical protein